MTTILTAEFQRDNVAFIPNNIAALSYVIGEEKCRFDKIVQILDTEESIIHNKLLDVAICLKISMSTINRWNRERNLGIISNDGLLQELLATFRSKYGSKATLKRFIDALIQKELNQDAENLGRHFGINMEIYINESQENTNNSGKLGCALAVFFTLAIIVVTCYMGGNGDIPGCPLTSMNAADQNHTLAKWAKNIVNFKCDEIHKILSNCEVTNKTTHFVSESVKTAYSGNRENFAAVVTFIRQIFSQWYQYTGYTALQAVMHEFGHDHTKEMIELVYFVKTTMQNESISTSLYKLYNGSMPLFPEDIRAIVFQQCVLIRNVNYNEYMYLSNILSAKSRRLVMTWREEVKELSKFFWFFEANYDHELFFKIRNDFYRDNSPMCPSPETFGRNSRKTVGCPSDEKLDSRWVIIPVENNSYFTIKRPDGCLLYSPNNSSSFDAKNRHTFTLAGDCNDNFDNPKSYYWDISRCSTNSQTL